MSKNIEIRGHRNGKYCYIGIFVIVDDEDYELLSKYKWSLDSQGYASTTIKKENRKWKIKSMHRLILGLTDPKIHTDHKNHNILDNRRSNLRECNASENIMNSKKDKTYKGKKCSSIYKGVCWDKSKNKWVAHIQINKKLKHLGRFTDEIEAAKTYDTAALKYFGEFALLNNIL